MGAENAVIEYEASVALVDFVALFDLGDHRRFRSSAEYWSAQEGCVPVVRPNGMASGGKISPAAENDKVAVAAGKVYLNGKLTDVEAMDDLTVVRAETGTHRITSVTVNTSGVYAAVAGVEGTAFSEVRGGAGGPPWIPSGSIEIGQVWLASETSGQVSADEIKAGVNVQCERFDYPAWDIVYMESEEGLIGNAGANFSATLPLIHSDDSGASKHPKKIFAKYYEPEFVQIQKATGFSAAERSYSVGSTQVYGGVVTNISSSTGQCKFTVYLQDGVSDAFLRSKDKIVIIRFMPDRNMPENKRVEIGKLGISRTWAANGETQASCTLSPIADGIEVYG